MGVKRRHRQFYSKRASRALRKLLELKSRYHLKRSLSRIQAYSKRRFG